MKTMGAKPMKILELHYLIIRKIIQFILSLQLGCEQNVGHGHGLPCGLPVVRFLKT